MEKSHGGKGDSIFSNYRSERRGSKASNSLNLGFLEMWSKNSYALWSGLSKDWWFREVLPIAIKRFPINFRVVRGFYCWVRLDSYLVRTRVWKISCPKDIVINDSTNYSEIIYWKDTTVHHKPSSPCSPCPSPGVTPFLCKIQLPAGIRTLVFVYKGLVKNSASSQETHRFMWFSEYQKLFPKK